jgi:hypothetical protein
VIVSPFSTLNTFPSNNSIFEPEETGCETVETLPFSGVEAGGTCANAERVANPADAIISTDLMFIGLKLQNETSNLIARPDGERSMSRREALYAGSVEPNQKLRTKDQ